MGQQYGFMLTTETGTEGPKHDPYSYEKRSVVRVGDLSYTVTLRTGMTEQLFIDGQPVEEPALGGAVQTFELLTGMTPDRFDRYLARAHSRCSCGCRRLLSQDGFPGETIIVCAACGNPVDSVFNRGDVE